MAVYPKPIFVRRSPEGVEDAAHLLCVASQAGATGRVQERHRHVWPEMQAALRETGWANYSLFLRDDGLLVGYLETETLSVHARGWPSAK